MNTHVNKLSFSRFESINKIISDLYNDDLPIHNRIINFFHVLAEQVYFDKATVLFFFKNKDNVYEKHSSISINWNDTVIKRYNEYYCRIDDTLPILDQPSPLIFRSSKFFDKAMREKMTYYKEYLYPNNCIYSIDGNLSLQNNSSLRGGFSFYRGLEKKDFTDSELQIIKLFQPHLSNILKHYGNELDSTNILFMLEDYNNVGVGILDQDYKVIRCNNAFKELTVQNNIYNETNSEIFNKAIQLCKSLNNDKNNINKLSCERKLDDKPIFLEVTRIPLDKGSKGAQFCCLIYNLSHFIMHTLNQTKEKYILTPRELDIIKSILKGQSNEEISKQLFISVPTIKKYLSSIYDKMDIKNQKQIFEKLKIL